MIQSEVVSEHLGLNDCRMLAASEPKLVFSKCRLKKEVEWTDLNAVGEIMKYYKDLGAS